MKADAFGIVVASVGIFFSFGLFKVGFYNGNDSENVGWHIVKNVYLAMFMIFGLLSFDFSRLLKDSGVDNFIFSKRFVVYMIYGVMFPILATIFDCKYISYIVANRFSTIRMRRAAAGGWIVSKITEWLKCKERRFKKNYDFYRQCLNKRYVKKFYFLTKL